MAGHRYQAGTFHCYGRHRRDQEPRCANGAPIPGSTSFPDRLEEERPWDHQIALVVPIQSAKNALQTVCKLLKLPNITHPTHSDTTSSPTPSRRAWNSKRSRPGSAIKTAGFSPLLSLFICIVTVRPLPSVSIIVIADILTRCQHNMFTLFMAKPRQSSIDLRSWESPFSSGKLLSGRISKIKTLT